MPQPLMKLYTRAWCGWCQEAKEWLDEHGFEYETIDIGLDSRARSDMVKLSGQERVPTLEVEGRILADFDTGQLEKFLSELGLHKD